MKQRKGVLKDGQMNAKTEWMERERKLSDWRF